jgi:anti-anti-sigma regulatory factor
MFSGKELEMYQHDSHCAFRFVLRGALAGASVEQLEQAWKTARSILKGKALIVDTTKLTVVDERGRQLLFRMTESGARLAARTGN